MRAHIPSIRQQRGNSLLRYRTARDGARRPIARPEVEGLEPRCLLAVTINEFPVPTASSGPVHITVGPGGNLWFTEERANQIGQINPTTHAISLFPIPTANSVPLMITAGFVGNLWFTENSGNKIGEI